jgi:hypothetical protein
MTPFYRKIAGSRSFALKWSAAVRSGDLSTMESMFRSVVPRARLDGLSTNGIGYFVDFAFPSPVLQYSNGTSIPPGMAQFTFSTPIHRKIAAAVLPLYIALSRRRGYTQAVVSAIRRKDREILNLLIRFKVSSVYMRSVSIDSDGVRLRFYYRGSKYPYVNMLFREIPG